MSRYFSYLDAMAEALIMGREDVDDILAEFANALFIMRRDMPGVV